MANQWVLPEEYRRCRCTPTEDRPLQLRCPVPAALGVRQWPGGNTDT